MTSEVNSITLDQIAPYLGLTTEQFVLLFVAFLGVGFGVMVYSLYMRWGTSE